MNRTPFPYRDFSRVRDVVHDALCELEETYILVTGETGTGKTALLRELRGKLDRARHRVLYFSGARRLGASGLVKVVSEGLRVRTSMCHSVTLDRLLRTLGEESHKIMLWIDEAHELAEETLAQIRALAEADLDGESRIQVLLVGMPRLRSELQSFPHLWRRIVVREDLTGLQTDELPDFLEHHFGEAQAKRLCDQGRSMLFEHGKGSPGLILPMCRRLFAAESGKAKIEPECVDDSLQRWDFS